MKFRQALKRHPFIGEISEVENQLKAILPSSVNVEKTLNDIKNIVKLTGDLGMNRKVFPV